MLIVKRARRRAEAKRSATRRSPMMSWYIVKRRRVGWSRRLAEDKLLLYSCVSTSAAVRFSGARGDLGTGYMVAIT